LGKVFATMLQEQGRSPDEIATEVKRAVGDQTPLSQALQGVAGTIGTGVVGSLIIGAFVRKK